MADIASIQNLLNKFVLALDENNGEKLASCFVTKTGQMEIVKTGATLIGREQVGAVVEKIHAKFGPLAQHWEGNVNVTFTDLARNRAYNKSYWKCLKSGEIMSYGQHLDDLMKVDGKWLINKRVIIHQWSK